MAHIQTKAIKFVTLDAEFKTPEGKTARNKDENVNAVTGQSLATSSMPKPTNNAIRTIKARYESVSQKSQKYTSSKPLSASHKQFIVSQEVSTFEEGKISERTTPTPIPGAPKHFITNMVLPDASLGFPQDKNEAINKISSGSTESAGISALHPKQTQFYPVGAHASGYFTKIRNDLMRQTARTPGIAYLLKHMNDKPQKSQPQTAISARPHSQPGKPKHMLHSPPKTPLNTHRPFTQATNTVSSPIGLTGGSSVHFDLLKLGVTSK